MIPAAPRRCAPITVPADPHGSDSRPKRSLPFPGRQPSVGKADYRDFVSERAEISYGDLNAQPSASRQPGAEAEPRPLPL